MLPGLPWGDINTIILSSQRSMIYLMINTLTTEVWKRDNVSTTSARGHSPLGKPQRRVLDWGKRQNVADEI